jgi:hypothetical protein
MFNHSVTLEISLFCAATAIALAFAYIYTLILYGPFLYYGTLVEERNTEFNERQKIVEGRNAVWIVSKTKLMKVIFRLSGCSGRLITYIVI